MMRNDDRRGPSSGRGKRHTITVNEPTTLRLPVGPVRAVFQQADDDGNGFVQAVRHFDRATILTLDTLGESGDVHAGRLCSKRLSFLEGALSAAPR